MKKHYLAAIAIYLTFILLGVLYFVIISRPEGPYKDGVFVQKIIETEVPVQCLGDLSK
ncbi:MAG: hypothetical protein ACI4DV_08505 [Lachnospiraceae bacterium]